MFALARVFCVVELVLVASIALQQSVDAADRRPKLQDQRSACKLPQQFYFEPTKSCANCSDLEQMFDNYRDWLGDNHNQAQSSTSSNSNRTSNAKEVSIFKTSSSSGNNVDVALSRLINLDSQDQPATLDGGASSSSEYQEDGGGDSRHSSSGSGSSSSQYQAESSLDFIRDKTKQATRFVGRLARRQRVIGDQLFAIMDECRRNQNASACQMWSNLCVLSMYSHSDFANHYQSTSTTTTTSDRSSSSSGRGLNGGWQQCKQFTADSICNSLRDWHRAELKSVGVDNALQSIYADSPSSTSGGPLPAPGLVLRAGQQVQLLAYRYSFDGNLIGVDQFGPAEMERFCLGSSRASLAANRRQTGGKLRAGSGGYFKFGKNMQMSGCRMSESEALQMFQEEHLNETQFVDLYIAYPAGGSMLIKPVPILVKNLLYNGNLINQKYSKDSSRWRLVHRFVYRALIADDLANPTRSFRVAAARAQTGSSNNNVDEDDDDVDSNIGADDDNELHLVYAKSVALELKFRKLDTGALLSSILLTIDYGIVSRQISQLASSSAAASPLFVAAGNNRSAVADGDLVETSLHVEQTLIDMQVYKKDLDLAITILSILSSIWSLIKCYNIQKCCGNVKLDLESLVRFVIIGCDTIALLLLAVLTIFVSYLFVTLKFQHSSVQVLAPNEQLESSLMLNLQLAFAFKLVGLAHKLYVHLNADIFFIDWERPRMLTSSQILNLSYQQLHQQQQRNDYGKTRDKSMLVAGHNHQQQQQQVSFWRPYTVINRWFQMQTLRRSNLTLQLIVFVTIVHLTRATHLASADLTLDLPLGSTEDSAITSRQLVARESLLFRALLLACLYAGLASIQILYKKYLHEPWIRDPVREFVDLCSVANVSLFCWLYPRFGYYVHGRNANGSGDRGIGEMNALLEREERDLCSKRGLAPNSDQQTFVLILPKVINDHYRNLLSKEQTSFASKLNSAVASRQLFNHQQQQTPDRQPATDQQQQQQSAGNSLLQSAALNLSVPSLSALGSPQPMSRRQGSGRGVDGLVAKHKSIQQFLTNFLEHVYKDIDYAIRDARRFENLLLLDFDFNDDEALISSAAVPAASPVNGTRSPNNPATPIVAGQQQQQQRHQAATFCKDTQNSFTSLIWFGLEFDLILVELLSFLVFDFWLGQPSLLATAGLLWFAHQVFEKIFISCSRYNLITKALIDEKFLYRA